MSEKDIIKEALVLSNDRNTFWKNYINSKGFNSIAEVGVYKGDFSSFLLENCNCINSYLMIDPWKNLDNWNKPLNNTNDFFEEVYNEALTNTDLYKEKRIILRGKTSDVIDKVDDFSIDLVYVDGDHTLKGIALDLIMLWDKVKSDGFIVGDDFYNSIWQHKANYEPSFVFPFAIYFAEAKNVKIYALPYNQFLIGKGEKGFEFINLTQENFEGLSVKYHLDQIPIKEKPKKSFLKKIYKKLS